MQSTIAENPDSLPVIDHIGIWTPSDTSAMAFVELPFDENRPFTTKEVSAMWRDRVGELPGMKELKFMAVGHMGGGAPLSFRLNGNNMDMLESAASELATELEQYEGIFDIVNSADQGAEEIKLTIKPEAEALGLTMASLGRQVRQGVLWRRGTAHPARQGRAEGDGALSD